MPGAGGCRRCPPRLVRVLPAPALLERRAMCMLIGVAVAGGRRARLRGRGALWARVTGAPPPRSFVRYSLCLFGPPLHPCSATAHVAAMHGDRAVCCTRPRGADRAQSLPVSSAGAPSAAGCRWPTTRPLAWWHPPHTTRPSGCGSRARACTRQRACRWASVAWCVSVETRCGKRFVKARCELYAVSWGRRCAERFACSGAMD
jgi:hypothetical protein